MSPPKSPSPQTAPRTWHTFRIPRWVWWGAMLAMIVWLLWMTLRPQVQVQSDLAYITTPAASQGLSIPFLIDFFGNMIVFVPLGTMAFFALQHSATTGYKTLIWATLIGAGVSAFIELTQNALPSRVATGKDWLLNIIGTLIGALMALWLVYRFQKRGASFPT